MTSVGDLTAMATVLLGDLAGFSEQVRNAHDPKYADLFNRLEVSTQGYVDTLSDLIEALNK